MAINPILFKAILSMDAYNRGYDSSIIFGVSPGGNNYSLDVPTTSIGNAVIINNRGQEDAQAIGFYGIAYENIMTHEKIISYRGTDTVSVDFATGFGVGSGIPKVPQGVMAFEFYKAVAGAVDPRDAALNISMTGHSLGGGLAGLVGVNDNHCAIKSKVA